MRRENSYVTFGSKSLPIQRELTPREWVRGMHKVRASAPVRPLWDMTGGEPLLYDGLGEMLQGARSYSDWSITSNTRLTRQLHELFKYNIDIPGSWTGSWHPRSGFSIDEFIENLKFIRALGTYTSVTIVLHRSTKDTIKADLKRFQDEGFVTQIHLALIDGYDFADEQDQELRDLYVELRYLNRSFAENMDVTPDGVPTPRNCLAGFRSVVVSSDGACYLCYEHAMRQSMKSIGRWGEWTPQAEKTAGCTWPCSFSCDLRLVEGVDPSLWMGAAAKPAMHIAM